MKKALILSVLLATAARADTFTLCVTPSSSRTDGTALKLTELSQCRLWDVTEAKNTRLLSADMLTNRCSTLTVLEAGDHKYTADCTDTNGKTSDASVVVTRTVKEAALAIPAVPTLTGTVSGSSINFTLTPSLKRIDGSALKKSDLDNCKIWNTTVANGWKLVTKDALASPSYTYVAPAPGTYKFSGRCTDAQGNISNPSAAISIIVAPKPALANPAIPTLKAVTNGNTVTFTVTPPTKRTDGTPLQSSEILKCGLFDTTDAQEYKTLSMNTLNAPASYAIGQAGTYLFGAKCYDTDNRASLVSALRTIKIEAVSTECIYQ